MLDDVRVSMQKFGWPDYSVFIVMLVICALIGVYFGFIEKKPAKKCDEESDYLVGGRQMKVVPIVMSLIARYVCKIWKKCFNKKKCLLNLFNQEKMKSKFTEKQPLVI